MRAQARIAHPKRLNYVKSRTIITIDEVTMPPCVKVRAISLTRCFALLPQ